MELSTAIRLIKNGVSNANTIQTWADLGAGAGLFTRALSKCLATGSTIYAIDKDITALAKLETRSLNVHIKKINHDFISDKIDIELLDGILMANALHFVSDKHSFLGHLKKKLKPSGQMIIIEYELTHRNAWVPHPITLKMLESLGKETGFNTSQLGEEPSVYNKTTMYSALLMAI